MDYRYFPDPDLLPLVISDAQINEIEMLLPDLPSYRQARYKSDYGLSGYDATLLTENLYVSGYFESAVLETLQNQEPENSEVAKVVANWMINEIFSRLNSEGLTAQHIGITSNAFGMILRQLRAGSINAIGAKRLIDHLWSIAKAGGFSQSVGHPGMIEDLIDELGVRQLKDAGAIEKIVDAVLARNEKSVAEFKSGKEKALQALVGQVMKASAGKANPGQVNDILRNKLAG